MTLLLALGFAAPAALAADKPNILVIMGDDIGYWNLSYNNRGMMGYQTPNIDRIANDGMIFTDYYAQQSCTAGRAAFITGQSTIRTGLTKVGMPGARVGIQKEDPTIADLLKPLGYATGQFGKNHLGDRNEFLPTVHGFDEFFGNLYHLNSEEEPEHPDYPKYEGFKEKFGPRGVLHSWATDKDDKTEHPRWGRIGKQKIEDTGALTKKRMETVDDEFLAAAQDFINRAHKDDKPFFVWFNPSRMHFYTHIRPENKGISGPNGNFYSDGMVEYDNQIGALLKQLDDLGIAENTITTTGNWSTWSSAPNAWTSGGIRS
jgi:arylsulfatase